MQNRTTLHHNLQQRVYGGLPPGMSMKRARGSKYLLQCLQKETALTGHEGCVNSIAWNESGSYLLSGADDCRLNIYQPTKRKLLHSIRSGHRANIFSAKFLPCSGDKWIVSCAGDGMIHFTDLNRETAHGQFQFNCHAGTTYEVITTPGDPNTFLSCGEDGTVRLFDLRTKTKCLCRDCKEDILIDCGKAITSINLNPIMPYHLGVGCEDSTVRVFDRRALSSSSSNKMNGMFCQFRPDSLNGRTCRVTSLHYSPDGSELLVSYCADYVYLFTLRGSKQHRSIHDDDSEDGYSNGSNGHRNVPPLKRLRLRGDWSDTGPNARPESEHPSPENSLMQRMSDMFARWLEESFRAGQRHRARTSSSRSTSVSSTTSSSSMSSSPPSHMSSSSSESSGTSGVFGEEPKRRRSREQNSEATQSRRGARVSESGEASVEMESEPGASVEDAGQERLNVSSTTSVELIPHSEKESENVTRTTEWTTCINDTIAAAAENNTESCESSTIENESKGADNGPSGHQLSEQADQSDLRDSHLNSSKTTNKRLQKKSKNVKRTEPVDNIGAGSSSYEGKTSTCEESSSLATQETTPSSRTHANPAPSEEPRGERNSGASGDESVVLPEHTSAATRIQRVYRLHKKAKSSVECEGKDLWIPEMTRVYKGHRNARTMIKEANFWGDEYVLSGSDCGRIFIWEKYSAELVMILQGDKHVVNCVQPHPFDPILASSGIDYDIKLWTPSAKEPMEPKDKDEIIGRNEKMLEESRDTITVPASFMIRMLASLNHARFGQRTQDDETDSDLSDD